MEVNLEIVKRDGTKTSHSATYSVERATQATFGEMLHMRCISRKALAAYLGLSGSAVSLWCEGKTTPSLITVKRIAEFVGLPMYTVIDALYNTLEKKGETQDDITRAKTAER